MKQYLLATACIAIGVYLLLMAGFELYKMRNIVKFGEKTTGVIIDIVKEQGVDGLQYIPVIKYTTYPGRAIEVKSRIGWINPKIGKTIDVFYYKEKPEIMVEDTSYSKYYTPTIGFTLGTILLLTGISLFYYALQQ